MKESCALRVEINLELEWTETGVPARTGTSRDALVVKGRVQFAKWSIKVDGGAYGNGNQGTPERAE